MSRFGLQWYLSCHSNRMMPLPILLAAVILVSGKFSPKIVQGSFFSPMAASMFVNFKRTLFECYRDVWGWSFMVRNTVKNGKSWYSAVICRKRGAFEMQFRPIVVSIFFKTCVKDHGETLQQIATKKDLIIMYQALLFAVL